MTRRHFLYGALGAGAIAALAAGGTALQDAASAQETVPYLEVPTDAVFSLNDCTEVPLDGYLQLAGSYEFPYGTLIWSNNGTSAACLLPGETAETLTQAGIISLASGEATIVLSAAVGHSQGFEIYDIRASTKGIIWTEVNILKGIWNIYTASLSAGTSLGAPLLADEGDATWEVPSIAAIDGFAFWQCLPKLTGPSAKNDSWVKRATLGSADAETIYTSSGRMSTPIYPLEKSLVITPRVDTDGVYHQLTLLDAASAQTTDSLVLPAAMKPLEAGYGPTGFSFSFPDIYNYGAGIAEMGTYVAKTSHDANHYEGLSWFRFGKTPTAPPAWCGKYFMVKSTRSVTGVDLENKTYFSCDVESGCEDWGDYLASTGMCETVLTYMSINTTNAAGENKKFCRVRIWTPVG